MGQATEALSNYNVYIAVIQTITMLLIGIVGYFVKRTIDEFGRRVDTHDKILLELTGSVQRLIGRQEVWDRLTERRHHQ